MSHFRTEYNPEKQEDGFIKPKLHIKDMERRAFTTVVFR